MTAPNLRHDECPPPMTTKKAPQRSLAVSLAVNIRRIEEIDASFDCGVKGRLDLANRHRVAD